MSNHACLLVGLCYIWCTQGTRTQVGVQGTTGMYNTRADTQKHKCIVRGRWATPVHAQAHTYTHRFMISIAVRKHAWRSMSQLACSAAAALQCVISQQGASTRGDRTLRPEF
eukprot:1161680-Pelagomonas_calceolata.AAC.3